MLTLSSPEPQQLSVASRRRSAPFFSGWLPARSVVIGGTVEAWAAGGSGAEQTRRPPELRLARADRRSLGLLVDLNR